MAARKRAAYHDGDGAERDGPTPYRYAPRETENQVGTARGQDGLAPDTEEAPVCLGVSGRWVELGQADKEMGRVFRGGSPCFPYWSTFENPESFLSRLALRASAARLLTRALPIPKIRLCRLAWNLQKPHIPYLRFPHFPRFPFFAQIGIVHPLTGPARQRRFQHTQLRSHFNTSSLTSQTSRQIFHTHTLHYL